MQLYYKSWQDYEVKIPKDAIILGDNDLETLKSNKKYPIGYCWEVWIINKILNDSKNLFDFNKGIVDIGAGLGEYCWLLPFKRAYAFEPNKITLYKMHTNLVLHDKVNEVITFNALLSDKNETLKFDGMSTNISGASGYDDSKAFDYQTNTLDEYNLYSIGLIKVDVEGMEEKVLRGGVGTIIRNNYPPILFECWDVDDKGPTNDKSESLFKFLSSLGYNIHVFWGDFETHLALHN